MYQLPDRGLVPVLFFMPRMSPSKTEEMSKHFKHFLIAWSAASLVTCAFAMYTAIRALSAPSKYHPTLCAIAIYVVLFIAYKFYMYALDCVHSILKLHISRELEYIDSGCYRDSEED